MTLKFPPIYVENPGVHIDRTIDCRIFNFRTIAESVAYKLRNLGIKYETVAEKLHSFLWGILIEPTCTYIAIKLPLI